ncbi:MAG: hypothetical protein HY083_11875 [Gammaproteobacteria bacterium]|nr:hypothetical protein [Gammaproteobacteria bacterium]
MNPQTDASHRTGPALEAMYQFMLWLIPEGKSRDRFIFSRDIFRCAFRYPPAAIGHGQYLSYNVSTFIHLGIAMDFITLREFRTQPGKVWKKLAKVRELVVTRNGKPFALLTETSPIKLEDDLRALRRAKAETAVASLRHAARERGLGVLSLKEINAEIRAARKEAKSRHAAGH